MKTKGITSPKVNVITLGCAKNLVDSEVLLTQLKGNKIPAQSEANLEESDIIIINTCGFIENAKQESIDTILNCSQAKKEGRIKKLYVTGCLSHRYKDELQREIPEVDAWFGTNELPQLLKRFKANYKQELVGVRIPTTPHHYAYLKISEGCDRPCSFCAIPLMRGKHVSRSIEDLVNETRNLVKNGTREIILIAQDSTFYGLDLYRKRNLDELLERLAEVEGLDWVRLHYAFPTGFPLEVLDVMSKHEKICNYLDMPLQHGSSKMLKLMRRGIDRPKTDKLIKTIRERVPGIALRTTLITGHPGETEEDFQEMLSFVEESRFERLGVFTYSHEEDTHSYSMADNIPQETKQERANHVMSLQEKISHEINQTRIGNTYKVLVDRKEGGWFIGRTEYDSPEVDNEVLISTDSYLRIGDFVNVEITDSTEFDLMGKPELSK